MVRICQVDGALILPVKVVPGASRTRCMGELGGRAKIAVASPPEGGKANTTLIAFLAKRLGVRKADVTIEAGRTSPEKTVRIRMVSAEQVRAALNLEASE